jgi:3-deoxy-7-phosphoheptulonate synthase
MATVTGLEVDRIVAALRSSTLRAEVPDHELQAAAHEFRHLTAESGELLLEEGSRPTGFGFMIEGQAAIRIAGREHTRLARGEMFGEVSVLLDMPVSGDVVAIGPVSYIFLDRERTQSFLVDNPHLCYSMLRGEARRLLDPTRWYSSRSEPGHSDGWTPESWRSQPIKQQPEWPNEVALEIALGELRRLPPLVFGGEARALQADLGEVAAGRAFLLQAGDCAESFAELSTAAVHDRLRVILQMAIVLAYASGSHIVKVARMAGQFAKPRSASVEVVDGVELPVYRGDIVNSVEADPARRMADPRRMITAYHHSAAKLNLIRSLSTGGFGGLDQVHAWNRDFVAASPIGQRYDAIASEIERALGFMRASRIGRDQRTLSRVDVWTSHEALLLPYEEALTRRDELTGEWYDTSAHMLWIGERTRELDAAHVGFVAGIGNPVGCKLGPGATPDEALQLCERLNPARIPGRLTLISRMGAGRVAEALPPLLAAARDAGHPVVWACDPMHGNTVQSTSGRKTRRFGDILAEVQGFFAACASESVWPGGLHIELTGEDVTECLGGGENLSEDDLDRRYATTCDPRLNARQSLDLGFEVADLLASLSGHATRA